MVIQNEDDEQYILNLYQEYSPIMRQAISDLLGNDSEIDDVVNEVFIKLLKKVEILRNLSLKQLITYLVYTGKHTAIDFLKHRDIRNKHLFLADGLDHKLYHFNTPEEQYLHVEEINELSEALAALPVEKQDLLISRYYLDLSVKELAGILNIQEDSVRKKIQRAKDEARAILKKRGEKHG